MAKRKNQDAAKRKEAKNLKKAIKRKAKGSSTTGNIQTKFPAVHESVSKLSEVIFDYAEPLIKAEDEYNKRAIQISIIFWNASLFSKQKALDTLESTFDNLVDGDQQLKNGLYDMFEMMYKRKQELFSNDKRFIVDYSLEENNGSFNLQVISSPAR